MMREKRIACDGCSAPLTDPFNKADFMYVTLEKSKNGGNRTGGTMALHVCNLTCLEDAILVSTFEDNELTTFGK